MAENDLEKAFLKAAEIAKKLPKNLQEAGFNRALEQLLGGGGRRGAGGTAARRTDPTESRAKTGAEREDVAVLIDAVDRTAHPDLSATSRVADRALKVLHLVNHDHGIDGLTAAEIATVLSRKFRLPTKANSVLKALERETDTVDVRGGAGASRVFHIMAPGEAYLERLRSGETGGRRRRAVKKSRRREIPDQQAGGPPEQSGLEKKGPKKSVKGIARTRKAVGRPGPKAAIGNLLQSAYFRSARMISDIQEELQHRRGHSYSVQELAPALVRSIRDGSLARERNSQGQYEYSET